MLAYELQDPGVIAVRLKPDLALGYSSADVDKAVAEALRSITAKANVRIRVSVD
jgi:hypothetical protein